MLQGLGKDDQALQQYETALSIEPKHAEAHFRLGRLLFQLNDWQQAEEHLAAAIQFQPKIPDAHYYMGEILQLRGQAREAIACFRRAVALNPKLVLALNALAWVYSTHWDAQFRDDQQAVVLAERACQLTQDKVPALLDTLAAAYGNAGRFAEAVETADKAIFLAQQAGNARLAGQIRACRERYLARQPFRDRSGGSSP